MFFTGIAPARPKWGKTLFIYFRKCLHFETTHQMNNRLVLCGLTRSPYRDVCEHERMVRCDRVTDVSEHCYHRNAIYIIFQFNSKSSSQPAALVRNGPSVRVSNALSVRHITDIVVYYSTISIILFTIYFHHRTHFPINTINFIILFS